MARKKVYIVADGMVTSLGAGTETNVEAVRAGKTGVALHSGLVEDETGNDLPVAFIAVGVIGAVAEKNIILPRQQAHRGF